MIKILSLGEQDWIKGICPSDDSSMGGTFISADGFDPSIRIGKLYSGGSVVSITGAGGIPTDTPMFFCPHTATDLTPFYYILGDAGKVYKYNHNDLTLTDSSSSFLTTNSIGGSFNQYNDNFIYARKHDLIKHGLISATSTTPTNTVLGAINHPVNLEATFRPPTLVAPDGNFYIANLTNTNSVLDKYDGTTFTKEVLDWSKDDIPIGLDSDGQYIVIATTNQYSGGTLGKSRILFWDTFSPSWVREYTIPSTDTITALKKNGDYFYAFTRSAIYRFNFNYSPQKVIGTQGGSSTYYYFGASAVGIWNDNLLFSGIGSDAAGSANHLYEYGSIIPGQQNVFWSPGVVNTTHSIVSMETKTYGGYRIFMGADGSMTGHHLLAGYAGTLPISPTAKTPFIDLGGEFKIEAIKLVTDTLSAGKAITITAKGEPTADNFFSDSFSFAKHGAKSSIKLYGKGTASSVVNQIQLSITYTGLPALKRLEIWGSPVDEK
jgi:hypothetical protein